MNPQQFFTGRTSDTLKKCTKEQVICMNIEEIIAEPVKLEKDRKGIISFLHSAASTTLRKRNIMKSSQT